MATQRDMVVAWRQRMKPSSGSCRQAVWRRNRFWSTRTTWPQPARRPSQRRTASCSTKSLSLTQSRLGSGTAVKRWSHWQWHCSLVYTFTHSPPLRGPIRRIPPAVVDLVKNANRSLKLGQLLCACRSPDFLLEIVQHQVGGVRHNHAHYCTIILLGAL